MKKHIFLVVLLTATHFLFGQTGFEGKVVYSIDFNASGLPKEAKDMLNGTEAVSYIKGADRRVELNMPIQSTTSIVNGKKMSVATLMDIMGTKYLIQMDKKDLEKEEAKRPKTEIVYSDEKKDIAGYSCSKAEVKLTDSLGKMDSFIVFYTTELPTTDIKAVYEGLKGFPMEYTVVQGGIRMSFTAKSVSKEPVADSLFEIPKSGYKKVNMEQFRKEMENFGKGQ